MANGMIVLDDELYKEWNRFKYPGDIEASDDIIAKIHRFSGGKVLTNLKQLTSLGIKNDPAYLSVLALQPEKDATLEELSALSRYKIILTKDPAKRSFPYVNIDNDEIQSVIGGFVMVSAPRDKAIAHLKAL